MKTKMIPFEKWYNSKSAAKFRENYGIGIHEVDCQAGWIACGEKVQKIIQKHFGSHDASYMLEFFDEIEKAISCEGYDKN